MSVVIFGSERTFGQVVKKRLGFALPSCCNSIGLEKLSVTIIIQLLSNQYIGPNSWGELDEEYVESSPEDRLHKGVCYNGVLSER